MPVRCSSCNGSFPSNMRELGVTLTISSERVRGLARSAIDDGAIVTETFT